MKIRIAAAEDIPEIEELYRQLFAAKMCIRDRYISLSPCLKNR